MGTRLLEDGVSIRLLETVVDYFLLEGPYARPSVGPPPFNTTTNFVQYQNTYVFCNVCGRLDYRLSPGQQCNAFNSAPAIYPQQPCQGTMTTSVITLTEIYVPTVPERDYT